MTDHLLDWILVGFLFGLGVALFGVAAIASGFDWLQWFAASTLVGLVVGAVTGVATMRDRKLECERYAEDDEYEIWGETR